MSTIANKSEHHRTFAECAVRLLLGKIGAGQLTLVDPGGNETVYAGSVPGPSAIVELRHPRAARRILTGGAIGFAEGYMGGEWDSPDLATVLDLGVANFYKSDIDRFPTPLRPAQRLYHRLRANTRRGSKRNIAAHYDLGNDFYELWLDDTMTYSCAVFGEGLDLGAGVPSVSLRDAQQAKWDRLLDLLQPSSRDHLLEIGCGWGGFAIHAAREAGCRITGITLSEQQRDWAARRVAEEGLDGRVDIRLQDYRDVPGTFSGIASIEMFEAVGERHWPRFFRRVRELTAESGRAALQTITIEDRRFEDYRSKPDFTQRYIFPGGMLPSPERFSTAAKAEGLRVGEPHFFGQSYACTLERWLEQFDSVRDKVTTLGFDERFIRMWRYYLAYCRAGFRAGNVDVMQVVLDT